MGRLANLFICLIHLYRDYLSPYFGQQCRFQPSCSVYTEQAINLYGPVRGLISGIYRILRCNPWGQGGDDKISTGKKGL